jgi:alkylation response protein AidB-like acyl-CoA dehydrogenase
MVPWPVEYGGRGADLIEWLVFEEEYYRAGAPRRLNQNGIFLLGPDAHGVRHARAEGALPAEDGVGRGDLGAGLVRAQRRLATWRRSAPADRDGDHWVINGQKTWASRGAFADWLFGMFRTDPDSSATTA